MVSSVEGSILCLARRVSDDNEKTRGPFDSGITMKDNANMSALNEV